MTSVVDVNRILADGSIRTGSQQSLWAVSNSSRRLDTTDMFESFLQECRHAGPTVLAQLVALPPSSRPDMIKRLCSAQQAGACPVVRLCPGAAGHGYPLADWVLSPLPETTARLSMALAIDYGEEPTAWAWDDVYRFARAYPGLAIVLLGVALDADRTCPALLDAAPNVLVDTSRASDGVTVRTILRRFGRHRVVFGTGLRGGVPLKSLEAILETPELEAVANSNARSLQAGTWSEEYL